MASERTAARLDASATVRTNLVQEVCSSCEAECWSLDVWVLDIAGTGAKACLLYREHMPSMAVGLQALGRWLMSHGRMVMELEAERFMLEHQERLF